MSVDGPVSTGPYAGQGTTRGASTRLTGCDTVGDRTQNRQVLTCLFDRIYTASIDIGACLSMGRGVRDCSHSSIGASVGVTTDDAGFSSGTDCAPTGSLSTDTWAAPGVAFANTAARSMKVQLTSLVKSSSLDSSESVGTGGKSLRTSPSVGRNVIP